MAKILSNQKLSSDFYLLKAEIGNNAAPGQFYMLRAWGAYPVLSRPISVFDADNLTVTFLYKVVGEGTEIFSRLILGSDIALQGPYGNGFPSTKGKTALVGGGVGVAPLYYLSRKLKAENCIPSLDIYLGFSGEVILENEFSSVSDKLVTDVGGYITDKLDPAGYDCIMTCGPEIMMRALYKKCLAAGVAENLYVSMENRMACGIGACLVCSCATAAGNKKVCKDGPVFKAVEVFGV